MLVVFSVLLRALELLALLPFRVLHLLLDRVAFNPRLGPLRYVAGAGIVYACLALLLVYVAAPIRGAIGHYTLGEKLHYDAERWLATAIYDARGSFVGTFDPRLDSLRDVNYTGEAIDLGDYVANPDHKSIPVRDGAGPLLAMPRLSRGSQSRRPAQSVRHRPPRRPENPLLDDPPLDRRQAAGPRRRRVDARHAVRSRHLQNAA